MSKIVGSRDPGQCRSHHQKMMNKYDSFIGIVKEFEELLYPRNAKRWENEVLKVQ